MTSTMVNDYLNAWRQYTDFSGFTSRQAFWMFMLGHLFVTLLLITADIGLKNAGWLDALYGVASFIPMLAIIVRRLHDTDRSGWWAWVFVIPVVGPFWLLYLLSQKGTKTEYPARGQA